MTDKQRDSQRSGGWKLEMRVPAHFQISDFHLLIVYSFDGESELALTSIVKAQISFVRALFLRPNHILTFKTITLGLGLQHMNWSWKAQKFRSLQMY